MDPRKSKPRAGRAGDLDAGAAGDPQADAGADTTRGEGSAAGQLDAGAGASSGRPLADVGTAVEVDREQILAEAAAIAASSPSSAPAIAPADAGAELDVQAKAADVAPSVRMLVSQCSSAFAPGWEITREENDGVGDALALVLAYWMPDGALDPKYMALLALAGGLYAVADKRRLEDGSFRSLRLPRPRAPSSSSSSPAPPPPTSPAPGRPTLVV